MTLLTRSTTPVWDPVLEAESRPSAEEQAALRGVEGAALEAWYGEETPAPRRPPASACWPWCPKMCRIPPWRAASRN